MFKRDNEQEERYSHTQQPTHKMRGGINQYGQQNPYHAQYKNDGVHGPRDEFDAASIRIRQFQQQQEKMRQMQNSTKSQFQKPISPQLSSIPEVYQNSSSITTTNSQIMAMKKPVKTSTNAATNVLGDIFNFKTMQSHQNNVNENEDASPSLSNVMEGLINVAEMAVASKGSARSENSGVDTSIQNDPLPKDQSKLKLFFLFSKFCI